MSHEILGLVLLGCMFVVILGGFPISFTLFLLGIVFGYIALQERVFHLMMYQIFDTMNDTVLAAVALFTFMGAWNDFLGPLIYLSSQEKYTIALGLATFKGLYATQWHYLMAASTVMVMPIIVLFFLAQRYFVQGIVMTGTKG